MDNGTKKLRGNKFVRTAVNLAMVMGGTRRGLRSSVCFLFYCVHRFLQGDEEKAIFI